MRHHLTILILHVNCPIHMRNFWFHNLQQNVTTGCVCNGDVFAHTPVGPAKLVFLLLLSQTTLSTCSVISIGARIRC